MKSERVLLYVGITVAAVVVFGLLLVMDRWVEFAPWPFQWQMGALAVGLSLGVFLWLKKPPSFGSGSNRRRRRLRDRYRGTRDDE